MAASSRRSLGQLIQQGWNEIPEVFGATGMALVGICLATIGCYKYMKMDGDNRRYKSTYVIMRSDDPKAKLVHKKRD